MQKGNLYGKTVNNLRENGNKAKKMDLENGNLQRGIITKVNGSKTNKMERDFIIIVEYPNTKDFLKIS